MTAKKKSKQKDEEFEEEIVYGLPDEEVAFRLVSLYFQEIARLGFKRRLDLDSIINAYFYTLQRLKRKDQELEAIEELVKQEENALSEGTKKDLFPVVED